MLREHDIGRGEVEAAIAAGRALQEGAALQVSRRSGAMLYAQRSYVLVLTCTRNMERNMANDLSNWICNIYIEVRHVSLEELGVDETLLKVYVCRCIQTCLLSNEQSEYNHVVHGTGA